MLGLDLAAIARARGGGGGSTPQPRLRGQQERLGTEIGCTRVRVRSPLALARMMDRKGRDRALLSL